MKEVTIWHNPRCSKSREALSILEQKECTHTVIKYLEETPTKTQIKKILTMLKVTPREMMRTKETLYKELELQNEHNDEKLIDAMHSHPKLMQRPIIVRGDKALIARPPSLLEDFLNV